mgnify:CR=1 FL=1
MLSNLHIQNYALIESLDLDFASGFSVITGETGAGKSILLGAIGLLTGQRAETAAIRTGAAKCVVEGVFGVEGYDLEPLFEEHDIEYAPECIVRREIAATGKSRAFINDTPVSLAVLKQLGERLIDIHSQHQTLMLSDKHFQLDTLDLFAGNSHLRLLSTSLWTKLQQQSREIAELEQKLFRISADKDYNEAQFRQLESANITDGELAQLEEEQKQLANAEEIKTGLCAVEELFTSASSGGEVLSMDAALKESGRLLSRLARFIPSASELSERVDSCRRELDDILSEISDLNR